LVFDVTSFAHPVSIVVRAVNSVKSYFYTLIIGNVSTVIMMNGYTC
jgi:hypothetical protein